MDSLTAAAARALAAGDPLGALNQVALRDDPPALALRGIAMAQLGDLVRRGRDRARLARPGLAREGARRRAGDARSLRRPGQRRARAVSRGPASPPDRAHPRSRTYACRPRPRAPASRVADRPRAGDRGDRDSTTPDAGGGRGARSGQARRAPRTHPGADRGGRERVPRSEHAGRAPDRERRGAGAPARGGGGGAGVEGLRGGRVPPCRARPRPGGLARTASGAVRAGPRPGKRGRETSRGTPSSRARSGRSAPTSRIAPGCGSRWGGCGGCCARWPT